MKAAEALIAWTPKDWAQDGARWSGTVGKVRVGPVVAEDAPDWTREYAMTGGAAYTAVRKARDYEAIARLFIDFNTLVVRDGIDPQVAHKAFLGIDEYAERISPDILGARP